MKRSYLKRKTPLRSFSSLKRSSFKHKKLDFQSELPLHPMIVLDRIFSLVIRQEKADERGLVSCYTCGIRKNWKLMQLGHFRPRQHLATRYDEINCKPQCEDCNEYKDGNLDEFGYRLEKEHGEGTVNKLYALSAQIIPDFPWVEMLKTYKARLSALVGAQEEMIQY